MVRALLVVLASALALFASAPASAGGLTFVVNVPSNIGNHATSVGICDVDGNPGNGHDCSFRAALMESNETAGPDTIVFDDGFTNVIVSAVLPAIEDTVEIDGTTAGCGSGPCVLLSGHVLDGPGNALNVADGADGTVIRGLIVNDFPGTAISVSEQADDVTIAGNYIGTDETGLIAEPNVNGIVIGGPSVDIGGPEAEDRNVVSGNSALGVQLKGDDAVDGVVRGNYIGVGSDGATALPNNQGVDIDPESFSGRVASSGVGARDNVIGPDNVISGNISVGVCLCGVSNNTVIGNHIGVDAGGSNAVPNLMGVAVSGAGNTIGGDASSDRNVISGNTQYGIGVEGSSTVIVGNYVGTNASGNAGVGNGFAGIFVAADDTTIGGEATSARNVISGNIGGGISVGATGTAVLGNYIGVGANGESGVGNNGYGVLVGVGGTEVSGNVISDNGTFGVLIQFSDASQVMANQIGVTASGNPRGNGFDGIAIQGGSNNIIGGIGDEANTIANNGENGVEVQGDVSGGRVAGGQGPAPAVGNTIRGNSIHSNDGLGIDNVTTGNFELPPPTVEADGTLVGTACGGCTVDIYSDDAEEGRRYEGTVVANGGGFWTFDDPVAGPFTTATATDDDGNTSEFSDPVESPVAATPTPEPTEEPTPEPSETPEPTATPTPSETPAPGARQGDTDCDKDADSVDGLFVLREVAGFAPSKCIENGDVDCDEDRDSVDALGILRHVAALPPLVQQEPCADIGTPI